MKTVTVKVTVEIPEEIAKRFNKGRKVVRLDNYVSSYSNVKYEVEKVVREIADQFGS